MHKDKHQSFLQVFFNTLGIKVSYKVILLYCWTWSSILKVLKVISLQYLYSISKNKLRIEFIISSFLIEVARHVQSTQNRMLVIFFAMNWFCFLLWWCKTFKYFTAVEPCLLQLFLSKTKLQIVNDISFLKYHISDCT